MEFNNVSALTNGSPDPKTKGLNDVIDMEQFLKLLTSQLTNQNPLDPMDNSEMAAQVAQLANLSNAESLKNTIETFSSIMIQSTAVGNYIGNQVSGTDKNGAPVKDLTVAGVIFDQKEGALLKTTNGVLIPVSSVTSVMNEALLAQEEEV